MLDTPKELLDQIALGESTFLEFKEVRFAGQKISGPHRDSVADSLAAFANGRGGVFVLGVDNRAHDIIGIPLDRLDSVVDFVRNACVGLIDPPLDDIALDRLLLPSSTGEEAAVIRVDVPRSLFVHRSPNGYMLRTADSKRQMGPDQLARLFQQRSQTRLIRFDEQPVAAARLEDLSADLWRRFRSPRSDEDDRVFLQKLGMACPDDGGDLRPTVAGVLMASEDPRRRLPNAYVQAVAYRGTTIHAQTGVDPYQIDAADISGPLDRQIMEACRFVAKNMRVAAVKAEGRVDRPQYDMTAVFEAVANAVAHRDYSMHGSKVRLRLFADRLELYSPGGIANSLTVESLRYRQAVRNETVTSLLAKCAIPDEQWLTTGRRNIMDRRGEGVPIILDNSEELSGKVPEYSLIDDAELLLTIYAAGCSAP